MTAVAPPLSFQPSTRIGWTSNGNGFATMSSDEVSRMFTPAPRKTVQRQNSASSIASTGSTASSTSTATATGPATQTNGAAATTPVENGSWAQRKKPARGLGWPPGKSEPATGISTARPQPVNTVTSGTSASSAMTALHNPMLPSQQMANGAAQANGVRAPATAEPPVILHLTPMNHTFERKTLTVPYSPDVLRVGRQTNQKTIPTPTNGFFDSKVLSRNHAEIYADRQGRIFIRDVKSSNGTFVNGARLSPENKESEPRELKEQDMLELGIDIVSEDQKTVVHHKVAARVEHAGIYGQGNDNFGELDPSVGSGLMAGSAQLRRAGSQGSLGGRAGLGNNANQGAAQMGALGQPQHMRNWLNPVTTDQLMKKLNAELRYAMQQSQDLARARQSIEAMLSGKPEVSMKDAKVGSERASTRPSPIKSKTDLSAHFSEPPAPPPSAPLPEKPDVAKALADPTIVPILRRNDTAKPPSLDSSPTRRDHSSDILRLCEELKLAKGQLTNQSERVKSLEHELAQERTARESAEERAYRLEQGDRRDSLREVGDDESSGASDSGVSDITEDSTADLQAQLDKLRATMDEMKMQMESYRQRADAAEGERDEARKTLAEMVEERRKANADAVDTRSPFRSRRSTPQSSPRAGAKAAEPNGHAVSPTPSSPTSDVLLERAGVAEGQPITIEQAKLLTEFLDQAVLNPSVATDGGEDALTYHGRPIASAAVVLLLGVVMMSWVNGWVRVER